MWAGRYRATFIDREQSFGNARVYDTTRGTVTLCGRGKEEANRAKRHRLQNM